MCVHSFWFSLSDAACTWPARLWAAVTWQRQRHDWKGVKVCEKHFRNLLSKLKQNIFQLWLKFTFLVKGWFLIHQLHLPKPWGVLDAKINLFSIKHSPSVCLKGGCKNAVFSFTENWERGCDQLAFTAVTMDFNSDNFSLQKQYQNLHINIKPLLQHNPLSIHRLNK